MANAQVITKFKVDSDQYNRKVKEAKSTLEQFGVKGREAGQMIGQFDRVLGTNIGTLGKLGVAALAARGAMEGLKKIIASSQTTTDAFGRAQEACTRIVDGFFESISRGNFSSFILGLQDVITNARNAYDALDALSTFNAFDTKETAQFEKRRAQIRAQIRRGVDVEENKKRLQELEKQEQAYYQKAAQRNKDAANAALVEATGSKAGSGWLTPYVNMGERGQAAAQKEADRLRAITESVAYRRAQQQGKTDAMSQMVGMDFKDVNKKITALENYAQLSDEQLTKINGLYAKAEQAETQYYSKVASDSRLMNLKTSPTTTPKASTTTTTKVTAEEATGPLIDLEKRLKELQELQHQAVSSAEWADYADQIKEVQKEIDKFKGILEPLKKGEQAVFTFSVDDSQLKELHGKLPKDATITETVKIKTEGDDLNMVKVTADTSEAQQAVNRLLAGIDGVEHKVILAPELKAGALSPAAFDDFIKSIRDKMAQADITSPLYKNMQERLADFSSLKNILEYAINNNISNLDLDASGMWEKLINGENIPDEAWQSVVSSINEKLAELDLPPIKINVQTGNLEGVTEKVKKTADQASSAANAFSALGGAISQIEDPAAKVGGMVAQAIASIALTFAQSLKGTVSPWDWIAGAASGAATMIATISAIKSNVEYHAQGGMVGQFARGTDTVPAMLTPGEIVLNRAQQANLAQNLVPNSAQGKATVEMTGEMIKIVLNNHLRAIGVSGDKLIGG